MEIGLAMAGLVPDPRLWCNGSMSEEAIDAANDPYEFEMQLRWSDQDALGHVNNARVLTLMEEARIRWSRSASAGPGFEHGLVVASLSVDYLRQVEYTPTLLMRIGVVRIGTKSFTVRHVGLVDGQAVFDGTTVMVPLGPDGVSPRALDAPERRWLEGSMMDPATGRGGSD